MSEDTTTNPAETTKPAGNPYKNHFFPCYMYHKRHGSCRFEDMETLLAAGLDWKDSPKEAGLA